MATPARRSTLDHATAMRLAATEYARYADLLDQLAPGDWAAPTCCPGWDVRDMAGHSLGMAQLSVSPLETARQMRAASRAGGDQLDALTAHQVAKNAHLRPTELVAEMRRVGPRATRGRRWMPALLRGRRMRPDQHVGDVLEPWTFGYLNDTILTRDPWMHRTDIAAATGAELVLTTDHDAVVVADVVEDWLRRHGRPVDLVLTGTAGGRWQQGSAGPELELDAVEFCRVLSGRGDGEGLLAVPVPF